jgi:hypothetical protein
MGVFIRNMPAGMFYLILAFAIGAAIALVVIGRQARRRAAIATTSLQAIHIAPSDIGGQAAQSLALGPLAIAALMLYARFG